MTAEGDNDSSDDTVAIAAAAHPAPPPVGPLPEDVACARCGYNLRGLAATGRCPECGLAALFSVARHRARRNRPPPDPRWARRVVEGAAASLAAFALVVFLCAAPFEWTVTPYSRLPALKTPWRIVLLAASAAAWVSAWFGAWKLAARPPAGEMARSRGRAPLRFRLARWALSIQLPAPFLFPALWGSGDFAGPVLLCTIASGVVGVAALLACVAAYFRRIDRHWSAGKAVVLAVIDTAGSLCSFGVPTGRASDGLLDLMLALPVYPYGAPHLLRVTNYYSVLDPVLLAYAALAVWNAVLMARLLAAYLPLARTGQNGSEATAASERKPPAAMPSSG